MLTRAFYRMPEGASNYSACEMGENSESSETPAKHETCGTANVVGSSSLASLALRALPAILLTRRNREPHRAHQTHLVDLFSHMDFHFVSAGFPCALWRGECEITSVVFERNVHSILPDHHCGVEAGYRFREAASDHLESLIMLVKEEYNKNCRGIGAELVGRFHRHNFVRTVKAQFLVKSFRCRDGTEQTLRWSIEVVWDDVLGAVLKIGDGGILGDRQLRCQGRGSRMATEDYE